MADAVTLLHVTDAHIAADATPFARDDHKVVVPGITQDSREDVLALLLKRLSSSLQGDGRRLDAVLFSGDAQDRGRPGGHERLLELLLTELHSVGITAARIVATPGNHDVPRGTEPSSEERYAAFRSVWQSAGCVVPWFDGLDPYPASGRSERYRLLAQGGDLAVYPLNTSNWSHVTSTLPEPLKSRWQEIPVLLARGDSGFETLLRSQLEPLLQYDMARVSREQLEALRSIVADTPTPRSGQLLRIVVMHHHVRSPGLREELKPFADVSNVEQVRAFLRDSSIDVVVHGHKHEPGVQFDHVYDEDGEFDHRVLTISGGTFEPARQMDAVRLISIEGLPYTPTVKVQAIGVPRAGSALPFGRLTTRKLWTMSAPTAAVTFSGGAPVVVEGTNLDEVYERARAAASSEAARGMLVVHLDLPRDDRTRLPLPSGYPKPTVLTDEQLGPWLSDLVAWWQLGRSRLEHRISYLHGARLRRYGGKIDQLDRIVRLLRVGPTTRALATLVDPFRDFTDGSVREEFASFCLVEFRRRDPTGERPLIDAIAFYRAQEFARWWPINVAELRLLQREICDQLNFEPGRITTIAADARTISRSPTQVAMPLTDRWLDQVPERLYLLANALVSRVVRGDVQREVVTQWTQTLSEMLEGTAEFNSDGIPVSIDGLAMLASYIEVAAEPTDHVAVTIARHLRTLASINETFEKSRRELDDFKRWAPVAARTIHDLQRLSEEHLH